MTHLPQDRPPSHCSVGFKEWAGVCQALGQGAQTFLLRKGGVAESQGRFSADHEVFWLAPTQLHEQEQGLRPPWSGAFLQSADVFSIQYLAKVHEVFWIEDETALLRLAPHHVWKPETISRRFHYRHPGLWFLGVRVYRLPNPFEVKMTTERRGCKTWIDLDTLMSTEALMPVLDEEESARQQSIVASSLHGLANFQR